MSKMSMIKTTRLIIRPIEQGDSDAIHVYAGSPDIDMMMFLPKKPYQLFLYVVYFGVVE